VRLLSASTPKMVRQLLASFGLVVLAVQSFFCYCFGYSLAFDIAFSARMLGSSLLALLVCMTVSALPVAMIVTNLRKPGKDALLWFAMPVSMFVIGIIVEMVRYGL
jgi:hypothetical protein